MDKSGNLFAASYEGGVYYSNNYGNTWEQRDNGLTSLDVDALAIDKNNILYLGTWSNGIYRSTDFGIQWNTANEGLTSLSVDDIIIASSGTIYIGTTDGVYSSTNQGQSWNPLTIGWNQVLSVAIDSHENIFADKLGAGVFRSTDLGKSWTLVSSDIWSPIEDIAINSKDEIYVAGANGVFESNNNGQDWTIFNTGLTDWNSANALIFDIDNRLIAATTNKGVCWTTSSTTSAIQKESNINNFDLSQNYPNPFNPTTKIEYSIPITSFVTLKVYDILGREVATLVNEEKFSGNYKVVFDGSDLSSGIYFYKIQAGNYSSVKKMVLLQ